MERKRRRAESARRREGRVALAMALVMAGVFLGGVWVLFQWRFRSGDIYPAGSSLRVDPVGGRAYYESLEEIPGIAVRRNFEPLHRFQHGKNETLFLLGTSIRFLQGRQSLATIERLEEFVSAGGRLVIAVNPNLTGSLLRLEEGQLTIDEDADEKEADEKNGDEKDGDGKDADEKDGEKEDAETEDAEIEGEKKGDAEKKGDEKEGAEKGDGEKDDEEQGDAKSEGMEEMMEKMTARIAERWGLDVAWLEDRSAKGPRALRKTKNLTELTNADLPGWFSALHFSEQGPDWKVLARAEKEPVLLRRALGEGTIILATDSYFVSNQALARDRFPKFLIWLTGGNRSLVFDETHHGTVRRTNIMQLARQFRLHGFFAGMVLFVVLLAWRSGSSLLPGNEEIGLGISMRHEVSGQESSAGFRRLLRRSVKARDLVKTSFDLWVQQKSRLPRSYTEIQMKGVREIVVEETGKSPGKMDPVAAYRKIVKILAERN